MNSRRSTSIALAGCVFLTFAADLALVERKYAIFSGGFGQSHALKSFGDRLMLLSSVGSAHLLLLLCGYHLFRALHRGREGAAFQLNIFALVGGLFMAALIAKFEVLSYFSDAISFQLVSNLGGGSLFDALLFGLSDGGMLLLGLAGFAIAYAVALLLLVRRADEPAPARPLVKLRWVVAGLILLPLLAAMANSKTDVRLAARRFVAFSLANTAFHYATDFDRDGYSWFSPRIDPAPFDASRHPMALDIPGDGVGQDGFGPSFVFAGHDPVTPSPRLGPSARNLVVVVLESTRGDVLGKRVNGRIVAPNLEALARSGSSWSEAYSHVGFTTASLKSLFSGQLDPLDDQQSLFRDLKRNGYRIGVFSGQPESFGDIERVVGSRRFADVFVDAETLKAERAFSFAAKGSLLVDEAKILRAFEASFSRPSDWDRPAFLYFNFQSPHFPYDHPGLPRIIERAPIPREQISAENRARVERTYWNAVAYSDRQLGRLVDMLKAKGEWDNTLLVVLADHGESLFEDGLLGHGHVLNAVQTRIPLVVNQPGLARNGPVGLADIRSIVLGALSGRPTTRSDPKVLQFIGSIDRPVKIALVEPGPTRTVLDPDESTVTFDDGAHGIPLRHLTGERKLRADRLIDEWRRQRWMRHLHGRD
jgi:hypothetical protein